MLFDVLGYVYTINIQDEAETRTPITFLISGDFDDVAINLLADDLKNCRWFQGFFDFPDPPTPMKVVSITEQGASRSVLIESDPEIPEVIPAEDSPSEQEEPEEEPIIE